MANIRTVSSRLTRAARPEEEEALPVISIAERLDARRQDEYYTIRAGADIEACAPQYQRMSEALRRAGGYSRRSTCGRAFHYYCSIIADKLGPAFPCFHGTRRAGANRNDATRGGGDFALELCHGPAYRAGGRR